MKNFYYIISYQTMHFSQFWSSLPEKEEELRKLFDDHEEVTKLLLTAQEYRRDLDKEYDNISRFIELLDCLAEHTISSTNLDTTSKQKLIDELIDEI